MGKCKAFTQMMSLSGLLLALPTEDALPYDISRDAVYTFSILREYRDQNPFLDGTRGMHDTSRGRRDSERAKQASNESLSRRGPGHALHQSARALFPYLRPTLCLAPPSLTPPLLHPFSYASSCASSAVMWASTAMAISSANDYFRVAWPHLTK